MANRSSEPLIELTIDHSAEPTSNVSSFLPTVRLQLYMQSSDVYGPFQILLLLDASLQEIKIKIIMMKNTLKPIRRNQL